MSSALLGSPGTWAGGQGSRPPSSSWWFPEAQRAPEHAWRTWQTSGHRRGLLFLAWSQAWVGRHWGGPWLPADVWTAPSWQAQPLSGLASIPVASGRGDPSHGAEGSCWEPTAGHAPAWGHLSSGHELHTLKSVHFWVQEHWVLMSAGDEHCFMLCSLHGYSASALQAASSAGSSGTPGTSGNPQGGGWALFSYGAGLGRALAIPRQAPEFPNVAFVKGNSQLSPKILPSSLGLPRVCNWHHHLLSGSSPKPKGQAWFFPLSCLPFRSVPARLPSKCIWKRLPSLHLPYFPFLLQSILLLTRMILPLVERHLDKL